MIKNIFLPEKVGTYYPLPQHIIGFHITKTHIYATYVVMQGEVATIKKFFEEPIAIDTAISLPERTGIAIKEIISQVPQYDEIRTSLPSSIAIINQLTLPFTVREKIERVLPFEIEPMLPFPVHNAISDFIFTKKEEDQSVILVSTVQKKYIAEHLALFETANISPNTITIDLFDLYGLYTLIASNQEKNDNVILLYIDLNVTRIAYIQNDQLTFTRTLSQGLSTLAKDISKKLNISPTEALENIMRFGLKNKENKQYTQDLHEDLKKFWQAIQFTINSFIEKTKPQTRKNNILLVGPCTEIPGFMPFITEKSGTPCTLFDPHELLKNKRIKIKQNNTIIQQYILSLSTALPNKVMHGFNLRRQEFRMPQTSLLMQRLVTMTSLMCFILLALFFHTYWQVRSFRKSVNAAQQEVIAYLQEEDLTDSRSLSEAIEEAETKINEEEDLWFAFSRQRRFSFLKHLQDMSTAIDRESIGLDLKKITITEEAITLDGQVKDHDALTILERELRESNLFKTSPILQDTTFTNLILPLKKNSGVK